VTDGHIEIDFIPKYSYTTISAIKVVALSGKALSGTKENGKTEVRGRVWPNPFQYEVNVVEPGLKNVKVYDVLGRRVLETEKGSFVMDGGLPTGVYFFQVETVENRVYVVKGVFVR